MLRVLVLFALVFLQSLALPVFAAEETDLSSDVTSLNYYPHQGRYYLFPRDTQTLDQHASNSQGGSSTASSNIFGFTYVHGLAHNLRAGISESVVFKKSQTDTAANGNQTSLSWNGFSDPGLILAWRFWSNESGWSADLGGTLTPSLGHEKAATANQTGNDFNGRWSEMLTANLFHRMGSNEVVAEATLTERQPGHTDGDKPGNTYTTDSETVLAIAFADRYHLNSDWFLEPGLGFTLGHTINYSYDSGASVSHDLPTTLTPRLEVGWRIAPETRIFLNSAYSHYLYTAKNKGSVDVTHDSVSLTAELGLLAQF